MKQIIFPALIAFVAASSIGCASQKDIANADFGSPPTNYEQRIKDHWENVLKDPDSARYRFIGDPFKVAFFNGLLYGGGHTFGYGVTFTVNAKNSYGGYTGQKTKIAVFTADGRMFGNISPSAIQRIKEDDE